MYRLPSPDERRCPTDAQDCDLLQPDENKPLRLLLVCPECGRWIVLEGFHQAKDPGITWREEAHHFATQPVAVAG